MIVTEVTTDTTLNNVKSEIKVTANDSTIKDNTINTTIAKMIDNSFMISLSL